MKRVSPIYAYLVVFLLMFIQTGTVEHASAHGGFSDDFDGYRLEAESYDDPDDECDPTSDREHTRVVESESSSNGYHVFLPQSGCGLFFDWSSVDYRGYFNAIRFHVAGGGGNHDGIVRIYEGLSEEGLVAECPFDRYQSEGWGIATCSNKTYMEQGDSDIRIEFVWTSGPAWGNLVIDYVDIEPFADTETGDPDGDGILNHLDNCVMDPNADQANGDGDWFGNACEGKAGDWCNLLDCIKVLDVGPSSSRPTGPAQADVGTSQTFKVRSTDINSDYLAYEIDWGDGTTTRTGGYWPGHDVLRSHSWSTPGNYCVKSKTIQWNGFGTSWSSCRTIKVGQSTTNTAPTTPSTPSGPSSVSMDTSASYTTASTDAEGGTITYTFDWGDGSQSQTSAATGQQASSSHSWNTANSYCVKAKARDAAGAESAWSSCRTVTVSSLAEDAYEPDPSLTSSSSASVTAQAASQSRTIYPKGDEDYVRFWASKGKKYDFGSSGNIDTVGYLYDSAGNQLQYNDDSGPGANFKMTHTATYDGYHYLRVKGYSSSTEGGYILEYEYDAPPTSCFSKTISGMTVTTSASCTTDEDGDTLTYSWSWDDGTVSSGMSESHPYTHRGGEDASGNPYGVGPYGITLTVSDGTFQTTSHEEVNVGPTDHQLAMYWAPIFHHNTAKYKMAGSEVFDEMVRINSDGDWIATNNWDTAGWAHNDLRAAVYFHVHETRGEYFIGYSVFHPRDFNGYQDESSEHENDMETVVIQILKDADGMGHFLSAITMAHNYFNAYTADTTYSRDVEFSSMRKDPPVDCWHSWKKLNEPCGERGSVNLRAWNGGMHPEFGIEHAGHGIYDAQDSRIKAHGDFKWSSGNVYYPALQGEVPGEGIGGPRGDDHDVPYELVSLNEFWRLRYADGGAGEPLLFAPGLYGAFAANDSGGCGDTGVGGCSVAPKSANAPWALVDCAFDDAGCYYPDRENSIWFEHPAVLFGLYFDYSNLRVPGPYYPNDASYLYRSVDGVWESFHEYTTKFGFAQDWTRPGATRGVINFEKIDMEVGDLLQIKGSSDTTWTTLLDRNSPSTYSFRGDTVSIRIIPDLDSSAAWGFYASGINWTT